MSKKIERALEIMRHSLGEQYSICPCFDGEQVLYRDLGNGIDFEIRRVDLVSISYYKTFCVRLIVWDKNSVNPIKEDIEGIRSLEELKIILDEMVAKYFS